MNEGAIIGTVLGDGHLRVYGEKAILIIKHSKKQEDYLLFKSSKLDINYKYYPTFTKLNNKIYEQSYITTGYITDLFKLYKEIYPNGKKMITQQILSKLNKLGLAFWYFDDGNYNNGAIRLSTDAFNYEEHKLIVNFFKSINIGADIRKSKLNYCIYFNKKNSDLFLKYIYPYCYNFPDSIKYKLGHIWDGNKELLKLSHYNSLLSNRKYTLNNKDKKKLYYQQNKEKIIKKSKDRYFNNKVEILKKVKEYALKNKDLISKRNSLYYQNNKIKIYNINREWVKNNPNKVKIYKKRYRDNNKEKRLEYQKKYRWKLKFLKAINYGNNLCNLISKNLVVTHGIR